MGNRPDERLGTLVYTDAQRSPWRHPDTPHRLLLATGLFGVLSAVHVSTALLSVVDFWALTCTLWGGYLVVEVQIATTAYRDLATDLAQQLHDGTVDVDDLRRARGYEPVEQHAWRRRRRSLEADGGADTVRCEQCGRQRYTFEACHHCGHVHWRED
jgi:hypothetical protein